MAQFDTPQLAHASLETTDSSWHTVLTWSPSNWTHATMAGMLYVTSVNESNDDTCCWYQALTMSSGSVLNLLGAIDLFSAIKPLALVLTDIQASVSGGNLVIQVKGKASTTLKWGVTFDVRHIFGPDA